MKEYQIVAESKKGKIKAKFLVNKKIGPKNSILFNNIDDARKAPLVQQLFYLPFVKSVRLLEKSFEVERFDILEWEDVLDEVKVQLENYLNEGGIVMEQVENEKVPINIYAESTPNPEVMKFVANKNLVSESIEFKNKDDAETSPLAQKLFHFPYVKEVFINANYISITKNNLNTWEEVFIEIKDFIRSFFESNNLIITKQPNSKVSKAKLSRKENLNPLESQIISILNEYVKPAVANDGGNIKFDSYDPSNKSLRVILQGACSGCPSSTYTLKNGIENMLKEMMPGKIENVIALNG